jgi:hypothetical protein
MRRVKMVSPLFCQNMHVGGIYLPVGALNMPVGKKLLHFK